MRRYPGAFLGQGARRSGGSDPTMARLAASPHARPQFHCAQWGWARAPGCRPARGEIRAANRGPRSPGVILLVGVMACNAAGASLLRLRARDVRCSTATRSRATATSSGSGPTPRRASELGAHQAKGVLRGARSRSALGGWQLSMATRVLTVAAGARSVLCGRRCGVRVHVTEVPSARLCGGGRSPRAHAGSKKPAAAPRSARRAGAAQEPNECRTQARRVADGTGVASLR
jgi:hypothetical protein